MQLIKPITFQASQLVSSNATETYATWSSGTTYALDAFVDYGTNIYQSLQASNTNHQPDTSPTWWILVGPDNTHAMFDQQVSTSTTRTSPLNVTVNPGSAINSAAFINLIGTQLVVTMTDGSGGPTVYSNTISLDDTIIVDWYDYFFAEYEQRTDVVLTDIPSYVNGRLSMALSGSGTVSIGVMTYGTVYTLGATQYGASFGNRDYSVKQTDEFGNTTFVQRAYSKRMEANVFVNNLDINKVQRVLSTVRATPCIWIGSTDSRLRPTVVYGFYKDYNVDISYPTYSMLRVEVEGLV